MVHKSFTLNTDANIYYLPSKVGRLTLHEALVDFGLPDQIYVHIVFKSWTPGSYSFKHSVLFCINEFSL